MITLSSESPDATRAAGALLAQLIQRGTVVGLVGDLGAGKTTFTQGLAQGLAIPDRITSPTFTLINEYHAPVTHGCLFHVDSYRLAEEALADQLYGLGLEDLFVAVEEEPVPHVIVIEWADRLEELLPADRIMVHFCVQADPAAGQMQPEERTLTFRATGPQSHALLTAFAEKMSQKSEAETDVT